MEGGHGRRVPNFSFHSNKMCMVASLPNVTACVCMGSSLKQHTAKNGKIRCAGSGVPGMFRSTSLEYVLVN
jgi:hypothetical protein